MASGAACSSWASASLLGNFVFGQQTEASLDILHGDGLPHPAPVPNDLHANIASIEGQSLRSKLLVTSIDSIAAAGKSNVRDDAATAVFCKNALLAGTRFGNQLDVLNASGLSNLVVDARNVLAWTGRGDVNTQIANLSIEVGRVDIPLIV